MKYPWFRLYTEIRSDGKMLVLDDHEFRIWINLLCLAAESKDRGVVSLDGNVAYPVDVLSRLLFTDPKRLTSALEKFEKPLQMIENTDGVIRILNFIERQYDNPSDRPENVRERKKRLSERQKNENGTTKERQKNDTGTSLERQKNDTDTDTDTDTEIDIIYNHGEDRLKVFVDLARGLQPMLNQIDYELVKNWSDEFSEEWVGKAVELARRGKAFSVKYADTILRNWVKSGSNTPWEKQPKVVDRSMEKLRKMMEDANE